jgi:hypothetical protein
MRCEVEAWLVRDRLSQFKIIVSLTSPMQNHCMLKKCNLLFLCILSNLDIILSDEAREIYAIKF